MKAARVLLVRHCASSGQYADAPLTDAGCKQALDLAERLAAFPIDHIVSSPYARAIGTIEPFAKHAGLPLHLDERLAERRLSPQPIDHWREIVRLSFESLDSGVPGGESARETLRRGWAAIQKIMEGEHRLPVVVSHGQLLSLVLHSIDPGFGFAGWQSLRNPDVYLLERKADGSCAFSRV